MFKLILLFSCILILTGCNNTENTNENPEINQTIENSNNASSAKNNQNVQEEELASFSTKIYTPDDENRQTNLKLCCSTLNGSIVKSGETFSFCNTIGEATPESGYKKADIINPDGTKSKGYGGGKCQVSSTLYNAVLEINNLVVVERHRHPQNQDVYYVELGKDASVSYGSADFKFRNDNPFDIKIYASANNENVSITIVKI